MAISSALAPQVVPAPTTRTQPVGSLRFDAAAVGLSFMFVTGLFVDGWAHTHGKVDQSFFTPWHAVLYGGWMLTALFFILHALVGHSRGLAWRESLPRGYFPSLIGAVGFGIAGLGDMTWHLVFGIEKGVEALLSPTHLALGITIGLVVSGPLRAAWSRSISGRRERGLRLWPAALSLALIVTVITFFLSIGHPIANLWGARIGWHYNDNETAAIMGMMMTAGLMVGVALFAAQAAQRQGYLPGMLALAFGLSGGAMVGMNGDLYPTHQAIAFLMAGAICDGLIVWLRPTPQQPGRWRLFAALVPMVLYALYFASIQLDYVIGWRIHSWMGIIVMAGLVGLLMSAIVPAASPAASPPSSASPDTVTAS